MLVAQALAGFLALAIAARLYRRVTTGPLRYSPEIAREVLAGGGVLFTFSIANNIQSYIDVVILSKLAPADVIGWYGAAKNIMGTMIAPALILGTASFPRLARAAANGGPFKAEVRDCAAADPVARCARCNRHLFIRRRCHRHRIRATALWSFGDHHESVCSRVPSAFHERVVRLHVLFALGRAKAFSVLKVVSVVVARR